MAEQCFLKSKNTLFVVENSLNQLESPSECWDIVKSMMYFFVFRPTLGVPVWMFRKVGHDSQWSIVTKVVEIDAGH